MRPAQSGYALMTDAVSTPDDTKAPETKADAVPAGGTIPRRCSCPRRDFPMRAGLPQKEPQLLAALGGDGPLQRHAQGAAGAGAPLFVLHDGPPYANGDIHIGHALNKILKDFVVRSRSMLGYDVDYVPGWDCHGLPIEWKIEEEYRAKGRRKDEVAGPSSAQRCRDYAAHWIDVQREEFKRLGVLGDWDHRYATMDFRRRGARSPREFHKFAVSGQLYRGSKPVMWCPVERTALADAEVEYHDHVSAHDLGEVPGRLDGLRRGARRRRRW